MRQSNKYLPHITYRMEFFSTKEVLFGYTKDISNVNHHLALAEQNRNQNQTLNVIVQLYGKDNVKIHVMYRAIDLAGAMKKANGYIRNNADNHLLINNRKTEHYTYHVNGIEYKIPLCKNLRYAWFELIKDKIDKDNKDRGIIADAFLHTNDYRTILTIASTRGIQA